MSATEIGLNTMSGIGFVARYNIHRELLDGLAIGEGPLHSIGLHRCVDLGCRLKRDGA